MTPKKATFFDDYERGSRDESQAVTDLKKDLDSKSDTVLELVESGGKLDTEDIQYLNQFLRENRRYLKKLDEPVQCQYHILTAWANYYAGELKRAMVAAMSAYKADPESKDAQATQMAMALLNENYKAVTVLVKPKKAKKSVFGEKEKKQQGYGGGYGGSEFGDLRESSRTNKLSLSIDLFKPKLLGRSVSSFNLSCLNGSTFSYATGQGAVCILFWKLSVKPKEEVDFESDLFAPVDRRRDRDNDKGELSSLMQPFAELFSTRFDNPKSRFVAVNIDSIDSKQTVMKKLLINSWPWAQVMAAEPANAALSEFSELSIDEPMLVIVGAEGKIHYAGPVSGFLAEIVLEHLVTSTKSMSPIAKSGFVPPSSNEQTEQKEAPSAKQAVNTAPESEPLQQGDPEEQELNPHADNLLQMAIMQKKSAKFLGYKKMINYCRQIIELYPNSSHAQKARELLRQMPEAERSKYKVTNEEVGL